MTGRSVFRKFGLAAAVGFGVVLIPAAIAWACLPVASLRTNLATIQAGQPVTVTGAEFGSNPVLIHLGALTGPVLATFTPDSNGAFSGAVTIPADTPAGPAVLVATEAAATASGGGGSSPGVPTRTVVQVVGPGGSAPIAQAPSGQAGRPAGVVTSTSAVGTGALLLVGLGVFGVALFLAGGVALLTGGRRRQTSAERVRS